MTNDDEGVKVLLRVFPSIVRQDKRSKSAIRNKPATQRKQKSEIRISKSETILQPNKSKFNQIQNLNPDRSMIEISCVLDISITAGSIPAACCVKSYSQTS